MELRYYLNAIWKGLWWIILGTVLAAGVSAAVSKFVLSPTYSASATVLVNSASAAAGEDVYGATVVNARLADSYSILAEKDEVLNAAIAAARAKMTAGDLRRNLTVRVPPDTALIEIKVEDKNAQMAAELANRIVEALMRNVEAVEARARASQGETQRTSLAWMEQTQVMSAIGAYSKSYTDLTMLYTELTKQIDSARQPLGADVSPDEVRNVILSIRQQMSDTVAFIGRLESELQEVERLRPAVGLTKAEWDVELVRLEDSLQAYRSIHAQMIASLIYMNQSDQFSRLRGSVEEDIVALRRQIAQLETRITQHRATAPVEPPLTEANIRARTSDLRNNLAAARASYASLFGVYIGYLEYIQRIGQGTGVLKDVSDLVRRRELVAEEIKRVEDDMAVLRKRLDVLSTVTGGARPASLIVVETALPPVKPVRPNIVLNGAVAGAAACLLMIVVVLLLEYLRQTATPSRGPASAVES